MNSQLQKLCKEHLKYVKWSHRNLKLVLALLKVLPLHFRFIFVAKKLAYPNSILRLISKYGKVDTSFYVLVLILNPDAAITRV